ncbi:P-loop containing nucleoside triphosphate hydrolase protein [Umbelopsis sp. AD052]|nr:P-loop containing nucleoside triphosphate hydrolase protein [Umbelopsis sp. AD052]
MSQNKQPVKKFAFSLGAKKQQMAPSQNADAKAAVMTSVAANEAKRGSEHTNSNALNKRPRITLDDEDDLLQSAGIPVKEVTEPEEDDPLEAFMADISNKAAAENSEPKLRRDDLEEEDEMESYVNHMKKKGVMVGSNNGIAERDENVDSDEEVYSTAAAIDAQQQQQLGTDWDETSTSNVAPVKREIEPLARVNHTEIEYPELEKYFYVEHEEIAALSEEQVQAIRKDLSLHVTGANPAKPCISFGHFGFDEDLMDAIARCGYTEPSGIQRQAIPVALEGRDIIGIAKTGSGKTAAFVLPMLIHIMDQAELVKGDGPIGLVLAPTRELAHQIYIESKKFAKAYGLKVAAVYGGASKMDQFKELRSGTVEILVATPGRLIDMIKMKATNLRRVSYLVLDEADRMFDLGFEPQVRSICDNVRPDRQTLLFSATFQKRVEKLAREVMDEPVRISVGHAGQANEDITQVITVLENESFKWNWLMKQLAGFCAAGSVIIFVSRKAAVDELATNLQQAGFPSGALHGDLMQSEREKVLKDYKQSKFPILVATDVAARGLDIKSVRTVVNFDIARDIDSHVHRIGRTGRAGEKGTAHTLIVSKEDKFASDLVQHLESSGTPVPRELMQVAMNNPRFRKNREGHGGRSGRGRGRGQGRGGRMGTFRGGSGRGGGGHIQQEANNSNKTPLGSRGMMFQKASTREAGAHGLHSVKE